MRPALCKDGFASVGFAIAETRGRFAGRIAFGLLFCSSSPSLSFCVVCALLAFSASRVRFFVASLISLFIRLLKSASPTIGAIARTLLPRRDMQNSCGGFDLSTARNETSVGWSSMKRVPPTSLSSCRCNRSASTISRTTSSVSLTLKTSGFLATGSGGRTTSQSAAKGFDDVGAAMSQNTAPNLGASV
jgi:hypothetical protein